MAQVVSYLVLVSVMFMMLGVGLGTAFGQVIDVAKQYKLVLRGVLANFLVVPLVYYLALHWLPFSPDVVIGLLIMAAVPIAPMAPTVVGMAKGDVPYAVGLMTIVALLCVPLTPAILLICLPKSEGGLELDAMEIIQTLLMAQLIPIAVGMGINSLSSTWTARLLKWVPKIGQIGLVVGITMILSVQGKLIIELGFFPSLATVLGVVVALVIGHGMMAGETAVNKRSLAVVTAVRNVALGLLIVNSNFANTPAVAVVLVFALLSVVVAIVYGKLMVAKENEGNE
jgi:bile acid:Na+ symporter, BASS family